MANVLDLTPSERRGALVFVLLLALGTAWDLWHASHPDLRPPAEPPSAPAPAGVPGVEAPPAPVPQPAPLDLNRASAEELDTLPGIGPVIARRIVEYRAAHGPFTGPEDLLAVRGIGPRLFERLRGRVRVAGPPPR